jgi:hypothetical protein
MGWTLGCYDLLLHCTSIDCISAALISTRFSTLERFSNKHTFSWIASSSTHSGRQHHLSSRQHCLLHILIGRIIFHTVSLKRSSPTHFRRQHHLPHILVDSIIFVAAVSIHGVSASIGLLLSTASKTSNSLRQHRLPVLDNIHTSNSQRPQGCKKHQIFYISIFFSSSSNDTTRLPPRLPMARRA